jgi:hypothetical protein
MSTLRKDLEDIEALFCAHESPNIEIIRSHSLEILISLSESDEFIEEISSREALLRDVLVCLPNPVHSHKALLFLVNLICNEGIANKLHSLGIVSKLYERILTLMKKVNLVHLTCSKSLLAHSQSEAKTGAQGDIEEVKIYEISQNKVQLEEKNAMLDLDSIKLSIMCLVNLAALSGPARAEILQKNTAYEANNFLILLDWLVQPQTYPIFKDFINVVISLSSDEEIRGILIDKSLKLILNVSDYALAISDSEMVDQCNKILRNLSFDSNYGVYVKAITANTYIEKCLKFMDQHGRSSEQSVKICRSLVDICLAILTSTYAFENLSEMEYFFKADGFKNTLEDYKAIETADQYYVDRIECLMNIFQTNSESS